VSTALSENRRMAVALFYLQAASLAGAIKLRIKRLKQPKYLIGGLLFVGYFAMMLSGPMMHAPRMPMHFDAAGLDAVATVFALFLLLWSIASWAVPSGRTALRFTEPEIAFLFPAPLTRVGLINFSLLRAQLGIFLSAFLLSLLFGRGRGLPGSALQHATAIWLAIATMRLHTLAASFTLDRFVEGASRPWLRRLVAPALIVLGALALLVWVVTHSPRPPSMATEEGLRALGSWALALTHTPPLSFLLAPFRLLSAPLVDAGKGWWLSLLPALALGLVHYYWVVRANVAFQEASIEAAAKHAKQVENMRAGKWPWARQRKRSNEPFRLGERGPSAVAFLWSGLIGAGGGLWRPRNVGLFLFATALALVALAASPWAPVLGIVQTVAFTLFFASVMLGAMVMQGRLRDVLELLDIYKSGPLPGRQIALGQLLTPAALIAMWQWYTLFVMLVCVMASGSNSLGKVSFSWAGAFGAGLVGPLLSALLMCIPFAWILWFPAWAASIGSRGGGFEAAGQRMIFGLVYMLAAALALAPAALLGGLVAWMCVLLGAPGSLSMVAAAVVAALVLVVELAAIVHVLGGRIDRLDVSTELR
jgi:hypothetical protein